MSTTTKTYETFLMHAIMPAPGWQSVYVVEGQHVLFPVYVLALVTRRLRELQSNTPIEEYAHELEEDRRMLVALDYNPSDGWTICNDDHNYCGLLPPDWTLEQFVQHCSHVERQETL